MQAGITYYAYRHLNSFDSRYFRFDSLSVLLNGLLSLILIPIFFHSRYYLKRHVPDRKYKGRLYSLLIVLATALSGIYFTDNIVLIWVCLEITTITVTFLIFHDRYTSALEAAWKYLFISSFGITLAFIGILFLLVQINNGHEVSLSFIYLQSVAGEIDPLFLKIAFLLLVTGYSIKMNLFPLYSATIDAKTTAPFPVNAITSTALINGGFIAVFRIYAIISKTSSAGWAKHVLMIIGVISLLIVAIQLFKVKRFKRMYAFSSMEHMALVTIALSLGKPGLYAALLHLMLHTLAKTGMFLHFGQIRAYFQSGWIQDTGNYFKQNGTSALAYILGLVTITAIPPSGLFVSELLIFKSLFAEGQYFIAIAVICLLTIIIYVLFKYSMQLLYGKLPENFQKDKAIVNKYEPVSQFVLFGLVIYLAYFPPAFIVELMQSVVQILN
ncbi:MAG: proton-conducting transporter membrane subunit [Bacteroidota bacterium]